jgi:hypothetical protein
MSMRFVIPGLSGPGDVRARVGHRPAELLAHDRRLVEHQHRAVLAAARGRHLAVGRLQIHDPGSDRRDPVLGHDEDLPEARVEALGDVAHELEMLALVLAHGNLVGAVGEHVGGLQHPDRTTARRSRGRAARPSTCRGTGACG